MDVEAAEKYIAVMERALALLKQTVRGGSAAPAPVEETPTPAPVPAPNPNDDFERHKAARNAHIQSLMDIDCWPVAVPPHQMKQVMSEEDQINRANAVLDMMLMKSIEKKHFLDFGCGDGWIARDALKRGVASSTGYDPKPQDAWGNEKMKNVKFVTDFNQLQQKYDVVVLYDVLDHVVDPMAVMNQIKHVLSPDGVVYVRCHPWTSKHASHLYKKGLNKAYIHLFLTWDELNALGFEPMFTRPEKKPLEAYRWWFHDFKIERERPIREAISEFFFVPSFVELILNEQKLPKELRESFFKDMEVQFVDFVLKP